MMVFTKLWSFNELLEVRGGAYNILAGIYLEMSGILLSCFLYNGDHCDPRQVAR